MAYILAAPSKYIQGKGVISEIGAHIGSLGKHALVLASKNGLDRISGAIHAGEQEGCTFRFEPFAGECSMVEIERLMEIVKKDSCDIIVGAGGGKVMDTAKAVAHFLRLPVVIAPTAASSDAPCSALSVIYHEDGSLDHRLPLRRSPDVVLVDTALIAKAPVKLLVVGMGDALSTYFESRACAGSDSDNIHGGKVTKTAHSLAKLCYETLLADGRKAKLAVEHGACTQAVENVIEANTLLSGVGFESGGKGAAHAINDGLNDLAACHGVMHGEKVAFGTLTQLILENAPEEELETVYRFCLDVGLPVTLADVGITENVCEQARAVARFAVQPWESIHNMPLAITEERVYDAILGADAMGAAYRARFTVR